MTETRPAAPGDLPAVAAFIAKLNGDPAHQSLHCADRTATFLRKTLLDDELFPGGWHRFFVLTTDPDRGALAAFGYQPNCDGSVGWLWGPWLADRHDWPVIAPDLLHRLLVLSPRSLRRIDAFLHVENLSGRRFLQARGFTPGPETHLYTAAPNAWALARNVPAYPALRSAHEIGFARLHDTTFPARGATPAQALLEGRDEEHAIFAATDGLRLLGSVCVSVNHAPTEGFIDYLAVKPIARGRGIGTGLVQTALRWTFETHRLPAASLCVSDWRDDARRIYEKAGFSLHATGVALRRHL